MLGRIIAFNFFHFTALDAKLKEFSLTLTQNGPQAPSFLTVCIESSAASKYGLPDTAMSLVIHSYGDANEDTCENFGPHFNPFGVTLTLKCEMLKSIDYFGSNG